MRNARQRRRSRPPLLMKWVLPILLRRDERLAALSELDELHTFRQARDGAGEADRWLHRQCRQYLFRLLAESFRAVFERARTPAAVSGAARRRSIIHPSRRKGETMINLDRDIRHNLRRWAKSPVSSLAIMLTVGLTIGGVTAVFSIVNGVVLRDLPYERSDRLVVPVTVENEKGINRGPVSYSDYLAWRNEEELLEHVAAFTGLPLDLAGDGEPERLLGMTPTEDYFEVMEIKPIAGRTFLPEEFVYGRRDVVILSQGLWRRRFGADPAIVGQSIRLSDRPYTVVGVVDEAAVWPEWPQVWIPLTISPDEWDVKVKWDNMFLRAVARLRPGVEVGQAEAGLSSIAQRVAREFPGMRGGYDIALVPLKEWIVGPQLRLALFVLLGAVGLVLLVGCVNVANLLLARAAERERDTAIRVALGAGGGTLARQWLAESLLIAVPGCITGIVIAGWGIDLLLALGPASIPRIERVGLDSTVLLFAVGLCVLTAAVFGAFPILQVTKSKLTDRLKDASRGNPEGAAAPRLRGLLVVAEVALSLILLAGAGLMVKSFAQMMGNDPGIRAENLLTLRVSLPPARYPEKALADSFFVDLVERIENLPGVASTSATSVLPLGGGGFDVWRSHLVEGEPEPPAGEEFAAPWNLVTPGYFANLGIPVLQGRDFNRQDGPTAPPVIIINNALAQRIFPDTNPIGKRIRSWRDENVLREIVGVVGNVRRYGIDDELRPIVYVPYGQGEWNLQALVIRTSSDPLSLASSVRAAIWELDPALPVTDIKTMRQYLTGSIETERFSMLLLGLFSLVALCLASVGLYSLMSYLVTQRTHEIGIRMALGARGADVRLAVLGQGLRLTAIGAVIGLAGALAVTRMLSGLLFEVSSSDPFTYVAVSLLLLAVASAASFIPALRATRVDPVVALRCE